MCDYSLEHVASRPAKVGDKLITTKFNNSLTRGFAAIGQADVAVCILPGTELAFEREVEFESALGFLGGVKLAEREAHFNQINLDQPTAHHDALEFPSGKIVLVTRLREGQIATVLQLPVSPDIARTQLKGENEPLNIVA